MIKIILFFEFCCIFIYFIIFEIIKQKILDGSYVAQTLSEKLHIAIRSAVQKTGKTPKLAILLIGDHSASQIYVNAKRKACEKLGIASVFVHLPADANQEVIQDQVSSFNQDPSVNGIIVQLPLPAKVDSWRVLLAIDPAKDVDGFHPENLGKMFIGKPRFLPATPSGILRLLDFYQLDTKGKHCVVVGRSNIVGKPLSVLLAQAPYHATTTLAHTYTQDLAHWTLQADFLFVAAGNPNIIQKNMVKKDAVVIDVGINRLPDGKLCGDVDFAAVFPDVLAISPVPKGVGPMTIYGLLRNTFLAYCQQNKYDSDEDF